MFILLYIFLFIVTLLLVAFIQGQIDKIIKFEIIKSTLKFFVFFLLLGLFIYVCGLIDKNFNHSNLGTKDLAAIREREERNLCLKEIRPLEIQHLKDIKNSFAIGKNNEDEAIANEISLRRKKENICLLKSECYKSIKHIEFSDCLEDRSPEHEDQPRCYGGSVCE